MCIRDSPREAMKVDSRYIPLIFDAAKKEYDVVLVDTSHVLNDINLTILDYSYMSLFIVTNDLVDLKNMKSLLSVFIDTDKKNYLICLNSSRDTGRDYMSMYDIRATIDSNIDYTISSNYYIKNIDKYVMSGEILDVYKRQPLLPDFDIIPIALVSLIHFCGDILNLLLPASFLNVSNSTPLKFSLLSFSHNPR